MRNIVCSHHEFLDGSGYPNHLLGDAVPLEARIVTVAEQVQGELVDHSLMPGDELRTCRRLTLDAALNQRGFVAANLYPPECSGVFHDGIEDGANAHGQCIKLRTRFPAKVPAPA